MSYAATVVQGLEACPFCREMFPVGETSECPTCGVHLVAVSKLPAAVDAHEGDRATHEMDEVLPWTHWGHARGPLLALSALGLLLFFLPWVHTSAPDLRVFTGMDIARRTGVTWSVAAAWFTMVPLVLSRRTVHSMVGARLAVAVLAAVPALSTAALLIRPPQAAQAHGITIPLRFGWDPALFASLLVAVIGVVVGIYAFGRERR
jgi:hypothetical protein